MTDLLDDVISERIPAVWSLPGGRIVALDDHAKPGAVLCGSFHPRHAGHDQLAEAASRHLGCSVVFELTVRNADKPPLSRDEVDRRRRQFSTDSLLITNQPTFVEKARVIGNVVFVIGFDTAIRIIDPKFYGGTEE